jgi:hypothetical protein
MQHYILIKPTRGPARLSLGIIDDLPNPWQITARHLLLLRQQKLHRSFKPNNSKSSYTAL